MEKLFRSAWGQLVFVPTLMMLLISMPQVFRLGAQLRQEQSLTPDNKVTLGRVTRLGSSAVRFGYNVPGEPGTPWSFERDQPGNAAELRSFAVGQKVKIEYSKLYPGIARVQGFGTTSSVQGDFQLGIIVGFSRILLVPLLLFSIVIAWSGRVGGLKGLMKKRRAENMKL